MNEEVFNRGTSLNDHYIPNAFFEEDFSDIACTTLFIEIIYNI